MNDCLHLNNCIEVFQNCYINLTLAEMWYYIRSYLLCVFLPVRCLYFEKPMMGLNSHHVELLYNVMTYLSFVAYILNKYQ